jgi:nitrite reductase/ring-hydroxylating ferredoxin subunit
MRIRVAHVSELPPGKGKQIEVEGRFVTVYNREGRFVATATRGAHLHDGESMDCSHHGLLFEADAEDSPARLHAEDPCRVFVEDDEIWINCA